MNLFGIKPVFDSKNCPQPMGLTVVAAGRTQSRPYRVFIMDRGQRFCKKLSDFRLKTGIDLAARAGWGSNSCRS